MLQIYQMIVGFVVKILSQRGMGWVAFVAAERGVSLSKPEWLREFEEKVYAECAGWASYFCDINLDKSDPFSDASLCNAIGEKTGMALRTLKDKESIRQDVERWAMALLEEKTGLHIRNIRDKDKTIKDVMKFASPVVADATGIPLTDISNVDKTKLEVKNYLEDSALVYLSKDIAKTKAFVKGALESAGMSLDLLVQKIVKKGGIDPVTGKPNVQIDAEIVVLGVLSRALIKAEMRRREEEVERNKDSRRTAQMRAALKRFRDRHGSRMTYERV